MSSGVRLSLRLRRQEPEVADWVQLLKQRYAGMKIVVGRDKLDEIQVSHVRRFSLTDIRYSTLGCQTKNRGV
jgi:trehalose-6-phosphate synthase